MTTTKETTTMPAGPDYHGTPCECNGGPICACPDCDHLDCSYLVRPSVSHLTAGDGSCRMTPMETNDDRVTDHDLVNHLRLRAKAEQDGVLAIIAARLETLSVDNAKMAQELDTARRLERVRGRIQNPDPCDCGCDD